MNAFFRGILEGELAGLYQFEFKICFSERKKAYFWRIWMIFSAFFKEAQFALINQYEFDGSKRKNLQLFHNFLMQS